jgi:formate hydrogenlyase subunit 3/multisubunit Na+/H+ antiporter MnhD subunit
MRSLVLPVVIPLATAAVLLLAPGRPLVQRTIALIGAIAQLISAVALFVRVEAAGIQVLRRPSASRWSPT